MSSDNSDPTKDSTLQKVVGYFLRTLPKPQEKAAKKKPEAARKRKNNVRQPSGSGKPE